MGKMALELPNPQRQETPSPEIPNTPPILTDPNLDALHKLTLPPLLHVYLFPVNNDVEQLVNFVVRKPPSPAVTVEDGFSLKGLFPMLSSVLFVYGSILPFSTSAVVSFSLLKAVLNHSVSLGDGVMGAVGAVLSAGIGVALLRAGNKRAYQQLKVIEDPPTAADHLK